MPCLESKFKIPGLNPSWCSLSFNLVGMLPHDATIIPRNYEEIVQNTHTLHFRGPKLRSFPETTEKLCRISPIHCCTNKPIISEKILNVLPYYPENLSYF